MIVLPSNAKIMTESPSPPLDIFLESSGVCTNVWTKVEQHF